MQSNAIIARIINLILRAINEFILFAKLLI